MPNIKSHLFMVPISLLASNIHATVFTPLSTDIHEPAGIYYTAPETLLRVDAQTRIGTGPCMPSDYSGCTLEDVNNDTDQHDNFKPEVKVQFIADDFADDGNVSNATLRLRGESSRSDSLKSYRIKLDSKKNLWRGERRLQLNKHSGDPTRIKNKLSFDLMSTIPNLPSLRTQFSNLYIDGKDYGLYTHVEHVGKEYLQRRNWDKNSRIYKANSFEFSMQDALLLDSQGKPLNLEAFESVLEIKRGKNHQALLDMISAVEDETNSFQDDVLNKHFNINNYLTWAAVHILMGNTDVTSYNYYLYNPKGTELFYFLPWDFDLTWGYDWQPTTIEGGYAPPRRKQGPHSLWSTAFGKRFLSQPGALDLLNQAVLEIKQNYLSADKIRAYTDSYYNLVYPLISRQPDFYNLDINEPSEAEILVEYNRLYNDLANIVEQNYNRFLNVQNSPMPFDMDPPRIEGRNIIFTWEAAVDLQGDGVTYDLEIADKPEFKESDIKFSIKNLTDTSYTTQWMLPQGNYYYKITARDTRNPTENWQLSYEEIYNPENDFSAHGVIEFSVGFNGTPSQSTITIDGNQSDWGNVRSWDDPDDISEANTVDWRRSWITQDADHVYFAYLNDDNINQNKLWAWNAYFDTDNSSNSGYQIGSLGTEYLLQGAQLWKYTGSGNDWSWQFTAAIEHAVSGGFAEFSIPKAQLNSPQNYRVFLYGANSFLSQGTPVDLMTLQP